MTNQFFPEPLFRILFTTQQPWRHFRFFLNLRRLVSETPVEFQCVSELIYSPCPVLRQNSGPKVESKGLVARL